MKICAISDTHGLHSLVPTLPEADVFIHAGDIANTGRKREEYESFNEWAGKLPCPKERRLVVGGNHDVWLDETHRESSPRRAELTRMLLYNVTYLQDKEVVIDGVKFYFSPWTPEFCGWGFNKKRGEDIKQIWDKISEDVDVLVTHGPPYGKLDTIVPKESWKDSSILVNHNLGCEELLTQVERRLPCLHIFGHIHGSRGTVAQGPIAFPTNYVNASFLNENYRPHPGPGYFLFELQPYGPEEFSVKQLVG